MHASEPHYAIVDAAVDGAHLTVSWHDGHVSRFHPVWLRHQCECRACGTTLNAVRGLRLSGIPDDITPALQGWSNAGVDIRWSNDGHLSHYSAIWLRDHCYTPTEKARRKHRPTLWDHRIGEACPTFDVQHLRTSPVDRLDMLQTVCDVGFCKVINAPTDADRASDLIELVGEQRQSHYGTYTLSAKKSVDNVGDVTSELPPHCDETYRLSTIGITVFQVLRPSKEGGASTLVDGFEAVRRLRTAWPDDFSLLCRHPITGQRYDRASNSGGRTRWFVSRLPAIRVDEEGDVIGVRLNERQIAPLDIPEDQIGPFYRALKRLYAILYDPDLLLTFPLRAGEGLIFNNQRILHGRTAYEAEEPPRAVLTSSVDMEEFFSNLRLLRAETMDHAPPVRYAQGMVF